MPSVRPEAITKKTANPLRELGGRINPKARAKARARAPRRERAKAKAKQSRKEKAKVRRVDTRAKAKGKLGKEAGVSGEDFLATPIRLFHV